MAEVTHSDVRIGGIENMRASMQYLGPVVSACPRRSVNEQSSWSCVCLFLVSAGVLSLPSEGVSAERAPIGHEAVVARQEVQYLESRPVDEWAIENGKGDWDVPRYIDIYRYIPAGEIVRERGGLDPFGNPYVFKSVRQGAAVNAKSIELCAEATRDDPLFWGHNDERVLGLIEAARKGDIATVQTLVKVVPDPNIPNRSGDKALTFALARGDDEMEKLLTSHGAVLDPTDGSALWMAVFDRNVNVASGLVHRFPQMVTATRTDDGPNGVPATWQPALFYASARGVTELIPLLLEHGADPNTSGGYVLWKEVDKGRVESVKLLVEAGARITPTVLSRAHGEMRKYLESQLNRATNGISSSGAKTGAGL